jgi:hypothetical protein
MESFAHSLASGEINPLTGLVWIVVTAVVAACAGAGSAVKLAGKDIGNELAAMMGGIFGPIAAVPGILLGLIILKFI